MRSLMSSRLAVLSAGAISALGACTRPTVDAPVRRSTRASTAPRGYSPNYWRFGRSPKVSRHWHDPKDPAQAARIEAAKAKRARKDHARAVATSKARFNNQAHSFQSLSLQPFYIAQ